MSAGFEETAKQYILYRAGRTRVREMNTHLMKVFDELTNALPSIQGMAFNIILDEPLSGLDPNGVKEMRDFLKTLVL